ncbi:uncharacterized protein BJ171DRAFT_533757 [Polychytrium aggregatum]|uniref:uncharacterized protein n=1 Tax=Polychytrium aggregatum TaxID=110093 RepID=UPI0022FF0383|nr:uncharacterized protein BJ171DRAFT_533757 [Polychytrium aggregatum]KAI9193101.1 hypothetical protein BJ171DRAFT_533757 [Polychytrium aggregatum]
MKPLETSISFIDFVKDEPEPESEPSRIRARRTPRPKPSAMRTSARPQRNRGDKKPLQDAGQQKRADIPYRRPIRIGDRKDRRRVSQPCSTLDAVVIPFRPIEEIRAHLDLKIPTSHRLNQFRREELRQKESERMSHIKSVIDSFESIVAQRQQHHAALERPSVPIVNSIGHSSNSITKVAFMRGPNPNKLRHDYANSTTIQHPFAPRSITWIPTDHSIMVEDDKTMQYLPYFDSDPTFKYDHSLYEENLLRRTEKHDTEEGLHMRFLHHCFVENGISIQSLDYLYNYLHRSRWWLRYLSRSTDSTKDMAPEDIDPSVDPSVAFDFHVTRAKIVLEAMYRIIPDPEMYQNKRRGPMFGLAKRFYEWLLPYNTAGPIEFSVDYHMHWEMGDCPICLKYRCRDHLFDGHGFPAVPTKSSTTSANSTLSYKPCGKRCHLRPQYCLGRMEFGEIQTRFESFDGNDRELLELYVEVNGSSDQRICDMVHLFDDKTCLDIACCLYLLKAQNSMSRRIKRNINKKPPKTDACSCRQRCAGEPGASSKKNKRWCPCFNAGRECTQECRCSKECGNKSLQCGQRKLTHVGRSQLHGLGLYTMQDIQKHELIGEYTGEVISSEENIRRQSYYHSIGFNFCMGTGKNRLGESIDAFLKGSKIRFINHATPEYPANCAARSKYVYGRWRVGCYATRNIRAGEELTMDYGESFLMGEVGSGLQPMDE